MEKRSWITRLFGKKAQKPSSQVGNTQLFHTNLSQWGGHTKLYQSDEVRKIIDRIATHAGKMSILHLKKDENDNDSPMDDELANLLSTKPNEYMTTYDFIL